MALLHGRFVVTRDDWDLAETIWTTSCLVRDNAIAFGEELKAKREYAARMTAVETAGAVEERVGDVRD
jgi:hypothetical protein